MTNRKPIDPAHVRKIPLHFAWVDHQLRRWLPRLTLEEMALLFFLHLAADKEGVSWYADHTLAEILHLSESGVAAARISLGDKDLITYRFPFYQLLEVPCLPPNLGPRSTASENRNI